MNRQIAISFEGKHSCCLVGRVVGGWQKRSGTAGLTSGERVGTQGLFTCPYSPTYFEMVAGVVDEVDVGRSPVSRCHVVDVALNCRSAWAS